MGSSNIASLLYTPLRTTQASTMGAAGSHFVIKHRNSELFVHILNNAQTNSSPLVFNKRVNDRCIFTFEVSEDDDEYGYIQHVATGKYVHPFGGSEDPCNECPLIIHNDKHDACLFNIDQETGYVKHKGGKFLAPGLRRLRPRKNLIITLFEEPSGRCEFEFVDPENTDREVDIPCDSDSGSD